jgi:large subunit ribosomal protein L15
MAHDFNLHAPEGANKRRRILGRGQGSGRGTTAGKGNKGQKSRSGGKTYVGFEGGQMPLYRRLARRGFSNHPFKKSFQIVNLCELEKRFNDGETVDDLSLFDKGLIKGKKKGESFTVASPVKILGNGELSKKLIFKIGTAPAGCVISGPAKEKIQKAGGKLVAAASVAAGNSAADSSAANT